MILKKRSLWYLFFLYCINYTQNSYGEEQIILIDTASPIKTNSKAKPNLLNAKESKTSITSLETEDEFLALLDQTEPIAIMGIMDNCGYCKIVSPEFKKFSLEKRFKLSNKKHRPIAFYQANGPNLQLHKHVKRESKEKFKIPGYPSFIFIKNGQIVDVLIGGNPDKLEQKLLQLSKK